MKKLIIGFLMTVSFLGYFSPVIYAEDTTTVIVTEQIPGLDCKCVAKGTDYAGNTYVASGEDGCGSPSTRKYKCKVEGTFGTVMLMLRGLIKYVAFLAILISVLLLVISGIKMSIEGKKEDSKKMFSRVIVSLLVLFSMGLILNTIAPWVYK